MFDVHFCLVSAQAAPNLLPILDASFKPREVVLLVSPHMTEKADHLKTVLQPTGIKVRQEPFPSTGDFQEMQETLEALLDDYKFRTVALNVTGGNKWMAITAQEVFRFNNRPVFYVDIDSGQLLFLDSENKPKAINAKVKLENYVAAYGYRVVSGQKPQGLTSEQRELCEQMVLRVGEWGEAIGQLNRLANEAEEQRRLEVSLETLRKLDNHLHALLQACQASGILEYDKKRGTVAFADEKERFFANGGWLEEYINTRLNQLKSDGVLQDNSHLNLKIASAKSTNEIDVAFMARNRLHIIECKTRRLTGKHVGTAGTESLYKLDSISDLGGLGTKSMLVSYRPLGNADRQRARDLRITVVEGEQIQRMKDVIRDWIGIVR